MNVLYETTWLAPGGAQAAADVRLNGKQIVDEALFFRAPYALFYPRGNLSLDFEFVTHWVFDTTTIAENFVASIASYSPVTNADSGVLQLICGAESTPQTVYSASAVLESVDVIRYIGRSVDVRYRLRCTPFSTTMPPNTPTAYPPAQTLVFQRGSNSIPALSTQLAIAFSQSFSSVPIVVACMAQVTGSAAIFCRVLKDTVTVNGFTVEFSAPLPDGSSSVNWWAAQ